MALGYNTYYEIPRLDTYADALRRYEDTKPIRGDKHETRPCGRRDQPWFSIWRDPADQSIHAGYGREELSSRRSLVRYHPSGEITLHKRGGYSSASSNERRQRLLRTDFVTHQYDTWVKCAWYDNGVKREGVLPLNTPNGRRHQETDTVSTFTRSASGDLVFLDYKYPTTHKLNKLAMKQAKEPFQPLFQFIKGIVKLQGTDNPRFSMEVQGEYFGYYDQPNYRGRRQALPPLPALRWGRAEKLTSHREQFYAWATSDDLDDRMRAAIAIEYHHNLAYPQEFVTDMLLKYKPTELLIKEVHTEGTLVRDRYKRYMWS